MPTVGDKPSRNGHKRSPASPGVVNGLADRLLNRGKVAQAQPAETETRTIFTAVELMEMELAEPRCIVTNLLTEGLNIIASRAKLGKSWLSLDLAIAVSSNKVALGSLPVLDGEVLYLAMEDNVRRLKSRMSRLLGGKPVPHRLSFATEWPRMDEGGMEQLETWIEAAPCPRLIVIDTYAKVRGRKAAQADRYMDDYRDVGDLHRLANGRGAAVLIVHHTRKAEATDPMDDVSGSVGITAAVDTILLLRRERGKHDACLSVHGRDIEEQELGLGWDAETCRWTLLGDAQELRMSDERRAVLDCVRDHGPITPKEVAAKLSKKENNIKQLLFKLAHSGEVKSSNGSYTITPITQ